MKPTLGLAWAQVKDPVNSTVIDSENFIFEDDDDDYDNDNEEEEDVNNDDKLSVIEERLVKSASSIGWSAVGFDEIQQTTSCKSPLSTSTLSVLPSAIGGHWPDKLSILVTANRPHISSISKPSDAPTSVEGRQRLHGKGTKPINNTSMPVTFKSKIKGSGYGGSAPLRPAWAKVSAARASLKTREGIEKVVLDLTTHLYPGGYCKKGDDILTLPTILDTNVLPENRSSNSRDVTGASSGVGSGELRSSIRHLPQSSSVLPLGPITCVSFSDNGSSFCAASHDGSAFSLSLFLERQIKTASPLLQLKAAQTTITRHSHVDSDASGPIAKVNWSHTMYRGLVPRRIGPASTTNIDDHNHLLITSGGGLQKCVSLFAGGANGSTVPLFVMRGPGSKCNGSSSSSSSSGEVLEQVYSAPVTSANFYYEDKFILTSCADLIYASTYAIDTEANSASSGSGGSGGGGSSEDILRLKRKFVNKSCAKLATSIRVADGGTSVIALAAHNSFRSALIFSACSDRSIRVFDMGAPGGCPQEVLLVSEAHTRQIKSLSLPTSSCYSDVSGSSLNCFLTSSTDSVSGGGNGLLRLWDIRANRCARQLFGGHVNRVHSLSAALSPDLIYVATGSEDRSCVIYDLRTSSHVVKLSGATDTVSTVAWHPLTCSIATGSLDGGVRFYSSNN
jgi:WD40 repeat protein